MENENVPGKFGAVLLALGGVVLFSAKAVFVKMAYAFETDVVLLLLVRLMIALPVYLLIVVFSFRKWKKKYPLKAIHVLAITGLGLGGYYLASYLDFAGLKYVSASVERIILFVYPTMVVLLTALMNRSRIPGRQIYAIVITYFGMFLIFYQGVGSEQQVNLLLGGALIIGCAFIYALFMIGTERLMPYAGSVQLTSYTMIVSTVSVLCHFLLSDHPPLTGVPVQVFWIGGGMAIFSTVIPSFMIAEAIRRLSASNVAIIGSIGPFSTMLMASVFLGESLTAFQFLGAIIIISGVLLVSFGKKKPDAQPDSRELKKVA
ncbi:MAG: DMT family transporter [Bacteroidales bacterium]|nr:DMT family transporter [Bacteroidales bacterium]